MPKFSFRINLILFFVFWFVLYFLIEWGVGRLFNESVVLWKLLAVSAIAAFGVVWPYRKKGSDFKLKHTLKWQCVLLHVDRELPKDFYARIGEVIATKYAKNVHVAAHSVKFRSAVKRASFGAKFIVSQQEETLVFKSKPLFIIDFFDGGMAREQLFALKKEAKKLLAKQED